MEFTLTLTVDPIEGLYNEVNFASKQSDPILIRGGAWKIDFERKNITAPTDIQFIRPSSLSALLGDDGGFNPFPYAKVEWPCLRQDNKQFVDMLAPTFDTFKCDPAFYFNLGCGTCPQVLTAILYLTYVSGDIRPHFGYDLVCHGVWQG